MFNRTNLTLSARTLSNRLNLGTRSLALVANVKNGGQTLRIRHAHHDVLRDGMVWYDVFPIMPIGIRHSVHSRLIFPAAAASRVASQGNPDRMAEDVRVIPDPRPADLVGRPEPCVRVGVAGYPTRVGRCLGAKLDLVRAEFRVANRGGKPRRNPA